MTRPAIAAPGATPAIAAVSTMVMPSVSRDLGTVCSTRENPAIPVGAMHLSNTSEAALEAVSGTVNVEAQDVVTVRVERGS